MREVKLRIGGRLPDKRERELVSKLLRQSSYGNDQYENCDYTTPKIERQSRLPVTDLVIYLAVTIKGTARWIGVPVWADMFIPRLTHVLPQSYQQVSWWKRSQAATLLRLRRSVTHLESAETAVLVLLPSTVAARFAGLVPSGCRS